MLVAQRGFDMWQRFGIKLSEPSTWRGVVYIAMALGLDISPEQQGAIVTAGLSVAGAIGLFVKDKP